jgi:hypothetical protein
MQPFAYGRREGRWCLIQLCHDQYRGGLAHGPAMKRRFGPPCPLSGVGWVRDDGADLEAVLELPDSLFGEGLDGDGDMVSGHQDVSSMLTGFNPFASRVPPAHGDHTRTVARKAKRLNSGSRQVVASTSHAMPSSLAAQEGEALGRGVKRTPRRVKEEPTERFFDDTEALELSRIMGMMQGVSTPHPNLHGGGSAFGRGRRAGAAASSMVDTMSLLPVRACCA